MAISNKHGPMVVATGNKSEMAVGYATLYGDMVGGYAVLKDVSRPWFTTWLGGKKPGDVIPQNTIDKAPSAEFRPNQKDSDTLPPYEILDEILALYIESDLGISAIVERGFEPAWWHGWRR